VFQEPVLLAENEEWSQGAESIALPSENNEVVDYFYTGEIRTNSSTVRVDLQMVQDKWISAVCKRWAQKVLGEFRLSKTSSNQSKAKQTPSIVFEMVKHPDVLWAERSSESDETKVRYA
jgi:TolB-like protein